ncbi:eukaryotic translation initiation factor 4G-like [Punica granatum]|uniref:Eukaryotic translation initiation factor 4G n=2 Tax=Punica granatum TaxID=22663 RepID=A0A6P8D6S8_PUNGR|nr:eukaryotic translation initiation factor 4G-like [Punica granatum]
MSFYQSRSDKSDPAHYRKSGRSASFNHPRNSSGAYAKGGAPAPSPSLSSSNNRSFKKPGNQPRGSLPSSNHHPQQTTNAPPALHNVHGGASAQSQTRGSSNAAVPSATSRPAETTSAPPWGTETASKAPTSQSTSMRTETTASATPVKGDASKGFAFQFGSISPGLVNGMQIPARTSSAPPNIDEQKRDQALHDTMKSVPPVPIPPAVKQQSPRKDLGSTDHSGAAEVHSTAKTKKDTQAHLVSSAIQAQKHHVHQVPRMSTPMTFHQPQIPVQFSGPNPQIQSQGMPPTSIQMHLQIPMPLPVANAPPQVQQQMFVPGLQSHQLPPQGIRNQGRGLSFSPLPAQLGNLGMGIGQYPQKQGGQFGGPRKTPVKITHPDTHQEVRLDKPSDASSDGGSSSRSQPNVPPQSPPLSSYLPAHQFNYYNNYGASTLYFPGPGSLPVPGSQIAPTSQGPRFNYPISQGPQSASFLNPPASNSLSSGRTGISKQGTVQQARQVHPQNSCDETSIVSSMAEEAVKQVDGFVNGNTTSLSSLYSSAAAVKIEPPKLSRQSGESSLKDSEVGPGGSSPKSRNDRESASFESESEPNKDNSARVSCVSHECTESSSSSVDCPLPDVSASTLANAGGGKWENYSRSSSMEDGAKNQYEVGNRCQLPQVEEHAPTMSSFISHSSPSDRDFQGVGAQADGFSASGISDGVVKSRHELLSRTGASAASISEQMSDTMGKGSGSISPEISSAVITDKSADPGSLQNEELAKRINKGEDQGITEHVDGAKASFGDCQYDSESTSLKSSEVKAVEQKSVYMVESGAEKVPEVCSEKNDQNEKVSGRIDDSKISTFSEVDDSAKESVPCTIPSAGSDCIEISSMKAPERSESIVSEEVAGSDITFSGLKEKARTDEDVMGKNAGKGESVQILSSNDKPVPELNRSKSTTARGKKKRRELFQKADAAGSTSDLYMAYKGPEEKETIIPSESVEIAPQSPSSKLEVTDAHLTEAAASEDGDQSKAELDDWEDAADISTPKLETTTSGRPANRQEGAGCTTKKYSRDFLLKFADQCTSLPEDFQVTSYIAEAFTPGVNISHSVGRDPHPSPGRPSAGPRLDRRGSAVRDDDRWANTPGSFAIGHDLRLDVGIGGNLGYRLGQGANSGVLWNPRAQSSIHHAGGMLPGLMQPPGSQGGMQRTGSDADRWQRATGFQQKGLILSPQTPLQMMHKAEKKYEVGKVTDEEQAKQRQLKAILNKLTPQNFEKLFEQVIAVQINNAITLIGLISQIFDKALMEPTFCEMYADLCSHLSQALPDFHEGDEKITFKRLLLNKCQEEFERGEREQEEANKVEEEGEVKQTEEEREEKRIKARRRLMLGNIRLIGELYKKRMLTEKIMHECMKKLLGQYQTQIPDEEDLEALCKLVSTIGEMIDHSKAKIHMDAYFERMTVLSNNMTLSSRVRFMLKDAIDLRKNKWQQRRKVEGPKKIEEVHRDAAQERHAQAGRAARSSGINTLGRRGPQMEYASRGNPSSPNAQMGSFRGSSSQTRGYGAQEARFEERQPYEPRTLAIPLSQRSAGDDMITLGPQGGLGRGLSVRGPSSVLGTSLSDVSSSAVDGRRTQAGLNGFSSIDRANSYTSREDSTMRSAAGQYAGPELSDRLNDHGGRDRSPRYSSDRPSTSPLSSRGNGLVSTQNAPSENIWPEERLRDMSIAAIREYYSAKDEKEVELCIKDLKSPSFYPSMVSLWVTDSFERKDMERDLLTKLLINLCKPQDGMLTQVQLIQGFESVLTTLEDAVNDAPKAPEFLGRMFGRVVAENVVPLSEIGRILHEGGEERGQLVEAGLAADVLGSTLEMIQSNKGEAALNEIRKSSNLRLEDFRPPGPMSSRMLEKFHLNSS